MAVPSHWLGLTRSLEGTRRSSFEWKIVFFVEKVIVGIVIFIVILGICFSRFLRPRILFLVIDLLLALILLWASTLLLFSIADGSAHVALQHRVVLTPLTVFCRLIRGEMVYECATLAHPTGSGQTGTIVIIHVLISSSTSVVSPC